MPRIRRAGGSIRTCPQPVDARTCEGIRPSGGRGTSESSAGLGLQNSNQVDGQNVALVFRPLIGRELSLVAFACESIEVRLCLRVQSELDEVASSLGVESAADGFENSVKGRCDDGCHRKILSLLRTRRNNNPFPINSELRSAAPVVRKCASLLFPGVKRSFEIQPSPNRRLGARTNWRPGAKVVVGSIRRVDSRLHFPIHCRYSTRPRAWPASRGACAHRACKVLEPCTTKPDLRRSAGPHGREQFLEIHVDDDIAVNGRITCRQDRRTRTGASPFARTRSLRRGPAWPGLVPEDRSATRS